VGVDRDLLVLAVLGYDTRRRLGLHRELEISL
jgi:hypothetical protein